MICSVDARAYLGPRPDGRWVVPGGAIPAARSSLGRDADVGATGVLGAGRKLGCHLGVVGVAERAVVSVCAQVVVIGASAAGPSLRRMWKERRASLRAIVSD